MEKRECKNSIIIIISVDKYRCGRDELVAANIPPRSRAAESETNVY